MNSLTHKRANYGIDAPGAIRNLAVAGMGLCLLSVLLPVINVGSFVFEPSGLIWSGLGCGLGALLMLIYSLHGKYKHRDRMLNYVTWTGSEKVLDIGTGLGLLMIGAAHRLSAGSAVGIDIWNTEDLSGNTIQAALRNAEA